MKKRRIFIGNTVTILVILILCVFGIYKIMKAERELNERYLRSTSPLDAETVLDLCEKLNLQTTDPFCDLNTEIYAVDYA